MAQAISKTAAERLITRLDRATFKSKAKVLASLRKYHFRAESANFLVLCKCFVFFLNAFLHLLCNHGADAVVVDVILLICW